MGASERETGAKASTTEKEKQQTTETNWYPMMECGQATNKREPESPTNSLALCSWLPHALHHSLSLSQIREKTEAVAQGATTEGLPPATDGPSHILVLYFKLLMSGLFSY